MDRFLLAENPLKVETEYILHTIEPKCLIEVTYGYETERLKEVLKNPYVRAYTIDSTGEKFALSLADSYGQTEWNKERFENLAARAFRWFANYINLEDYEIAKSKKAREN